MAKGIEHHRDEKKKAKMTLKEKRQKKHEKKEAKLHRFDVNEPSQF